MIDVEQTGNQPESQPLPLTVALAADQLELLASRVADVLERRRDEQLVTMNPLALLTPDDRPQRKERERFEWTPEHVTALLDASRRIAEKPTSQPYSLMLETAIRTGLRLGELLGMQWRDVALRQGVLYVRRQWTRDGAYSEPKTQAAIRQVPLASEMVKKLAEHKLASDYSDDEEPVFASATGRPLNHRNIAQRGSEAAAKEAGLHAEGKPRVTFHDLRHAFASIMIERGLSSTVLAHVMGHRDATTTERKYIHLFNRLRTDDQVRQAMLSAMSL